ncbi:hypothetical protein ScPMuIL_012410 [Solemya velum]
MCRQSIGYLAGFAILAAVTTDVVGAPVRQGITLTHLRSRFQSATITARKTPRIHNPRISSDTVYAAQDSDQDGIIMLSKVDTASQTKTFTGYGESGGQSLEGKLTKRFNAQPLVGSYASVYKNHRSSSLRAVNSNRQKPRPEEPSDLEFEIDMDYLQCDEFLIGHVRLESQTSFLFRDANKWYMDDFRTAEGSFGKEFLRRDRVRIRERGLEGGYFVFVCITSNLGIQEKNDYESRDCQLDEGTRTAVI